MSITSYKIPIPIKISTSVHVDGEHAGGEPRVHAEGRGPGGIKGQVRHSGKDPNSVNDILTTRSDIFLSITLTIPYLAYACLGPPQCYLPYEDGISE